MHDDLARLWRKANLFATVHEDPALDMVLGDLQRPTEALARENAELRAERDAARAEVEWLNSHISSK